MEYNDIYDKERNLTGRVHRRGTRWRAGEYGLVVCVWVYDGRGRILLTRRAPQKTAPGTWENSGGAAKAGESSIQAIVRELYEETGIVAEQRQFEFLESGQDGSMHYDHYCLHCSIDISQIVLQPGETDAVKWATFEEIHQMIADKQICRAIAQQFLRMEPALRARQYAQG